MIERYLYKIVPALAVAAALLGPVAAHALPKIGQQLPSFSVSTPASQQVTNQNYSNRVLLLVFSTDFCSACKKAVPSFNTLADRYGKQGFHVLGLFSGFGMDDDDLKEYIKTYAVTYPMALFEERTARNQFGVISVPYSMLVNKKGVVAGMYFGYSEGTVKKLEDQIKKLLAE